MILATECRALFPSGVFSLVMGHPGVDRQCGSPQRADSLPSAPQLEGNRTDKISKEPKSEATLFTASPASSTAHQEKCRRLHQETTGSRRGNAIVHFSWRSAAGLHRCQVDLVHELRPVA